MIKKSPFHLGSSILVVIRCICILAVSLNSACMYTPKILLQVHICEVVSVLLFMNPLLKVIYEQTMKVLQEHRHEG